MFDVSVGGGSPVTYSFVCHGPKKFNHPHRAAACRDIKRVFIYQMSYEVEFTAALKAMIDPYRLSKPVPCNTGPVRITIRRVVGAEGELIAAEELNRNGRINFSSGCAMKKDYVRRRPLQSVSVGIVNETQDVNNIQHYVHILKFSITILIIALHSR